jgi:hypothetical protein
MGIRFYCPNGHKLNVKEFQAGRKGICPFCGAKIQIPTESTRPGSHDAAQPGGGPDTAAPGSTPSGEKADDDSDPSAESLAVPSDAGAGAGPVPIVSAPQGPEATFLPGTPPVAGSGPRAAAADPLTEAGDVVWYVRPPSGGQFGPANGDIMRGWLAEGRVSADSLVWREGWRDWCEAGGVFPQLREQQPAPAFDPASPAGPAAPASSAGAAPSAGAAAVPALPRAAIRPQPRPVRRTKEILIIAALVVAALSLIVVFLYVLFK